MLHKGVHSQLNAAVRKLVIVSEILLLSQIRWLLPNFLKFGSCHLI
jgi:hypothetical protein